MSEVDVVTYTDDLVRAWGRGDRAGTSALATPEAAARLSAFATPGGRFWARIHTDVVVGARSVTYCDSYRGEVLTLGIDALAQPTDHHLVYRVTFVHAPRPTTAWMGAPRGGALARQSVTRHAGFWRDRSRLPGS